MHRCLTVNFKFTEVIMNKKDLSGYEKIFQMAISIFSNYDKSIAQKINQGYVNDISDVKNLFLDNNITLFLTKEFNKTSKDSIVLAMFYWLFFGNGYERMVERGEELRKDKRLDSYQKQFIISIIHKTVESSIKLGFRTKEDWENHFNLMDLANSDSKDVLSWTLNKFTTVNRSQDEQKNQTLPEHLWNRIEHFIEAKHSEYDLACLKIALEESSLLNINTKSFRTELNERFGSKISIIGERGIQKQYKQLNTFTAEKNFIKDLPETRSFIEQIKNILSD